MVSGMNGTLPIGLPLPGQTFIGNSACEDWLELTSRASSLEAAVAIRDLRPIRVERDVVGMPLLVLLLHNLYFAAGIPLTLSAATT